MEAGYGATSAGPGTDVKDRPRRWSSLISEGTKEDLKEICKLSFTIITINTVSNLVNPIALMFIGQLGVVQLDGVSLASTLYNITAEAVTAGMTSASDTLFAQSYGSHNKKKVGVYLQQGLMIIMLFILPTWAIHLNAEGLLLLLGQDREVANVTGRYLLYTMPGMFFFFLYRILASYLRAVNYLFILLVAGAAGTVVNVVGHYLIVTIYGYGIEGSALVQDATYFVMFLVQCLFILIKKVYKETWGGWTKEAFQNWGYFLYIGVGGFTLWTIEWTGFECGSIFSGILGKEDLAAQAVLFQMFLILYSFPFGFLVGGNVRIAMLLGSGDVERTKRNAKISVIINIASTMAICVLIIVLRWELPKIFSSSERVIEMAAGLMPLVALDLLMDGVNGGLSGILRGCGRHMTGVAISLTEYLAFIIPLCAIFMFLTPLGVAGFWIATSLGLFLGNSFYVIYIFFFLNWKKEGEQALKNAGVSSETGNHQIWAEESVTNKETSIIPNIDREVHSETIGLLSYKEQARAETDLRWRCFQQTNQLHLKPHVSFVNMIPSGKQPGQGNLSFRTLLWRRGALISFMFTIFTVSVLTRIFLAPPAFTDMTPLCLPVNGSVLSETNSTLPFCNSTLTPVTITSNPITTM